MDRRQEWIDAAWRGDANAFGNLVQSYQTPVYNLTYRMLGNAPDAEDAAQEAFVRAYTKLDSYDPMRSFSSWLLAIAAHYCIDRLRRRRWVWFSLQDKDLPSDILASPEISPEGCAVNHEMEARVQTMLDSLRPDYRAALVLRYWYDLSYEEIAKMTGSTVSAVKSRLFRARRVLAKELQPAAPNTNARLQKQVKRDKLRLAGRSAVQPV